MRLNFVAALAALSSLFISSVKDAAAEPLLSGKAEAEKVFSDRFQLDLINALKNKEFPRVDALIHGGNIDAAATNGETVLWWEANVGDFDAFEYLLKKGANPVCQVLNGLNITEVCAAQTDTRFLLSDLRHGANVNMISSFYRQTPIFAAIMYRNLKNTELLLDSGAYCDVSNDMGETPVVFANVRAFDIVLALLHHGCNPAFKDRFGNDLWKSLEEVNVCKDDPSYHAWEDAKALAFEMRKTRNKEGR